MIDAEQRHPYRVVWLTKRGASLQPEVVPAVEALVGRIFACMSEKEMNQLSDLISRLKAHVAELP